MEENKKDKWSVMGIWNEQLTFGRKERELKRRSRIWASEIGKNHYERYLKMTAVKPDFDYDERTLRKFEAGNFFERIIGFVLMSAGILIHDNKWHNIPEDNEHVEVSVKPDFVAGGKPDWEKAKKEIGEELLFKLMPNLGRIASALVEQFSKKFPNGLNPLVYEIKSMNSMVFWSKKDYLGSAYPHHIMQLFTGMKATKLPEGRILYISKDDLTTAEFPFYLKDEKLNEKYENDVKSMTKYIREGIEPPKPKFVVFDERTKLRFQYKKEKIVRLGCHVENWEVGWSNYISKITGIEGKTQKEVADKWKQSIKPQMKELNDKMKEGIKAEIDNSPKGKKKIKEDREFEKKVEDMGDNEE